MTYLTKTAFAVSTFALLAAPALAHNHGDKKDGDMTKNKAGYEMMVPEAKAPLAEQRAEDALERAEELQKDGQMRKAQMVGQTAVRNQISSEIAEYEAETKAGQELEVVTVDTPNSGARGGSASTLVDIDVDNRIEAGTDGEPVLVMCPAGTTPQPNGTCMITGDGSEFMK